MNGNYNQYSKDFMKNKYGNFHNVMALERDKDIVWLMIGRDNRQLRARNSIMSEPWQATKSTTTFTCKALYHSNTSLKVLFKTAMTRRNSSKNQASYWKLKDGLMILRDLTEENRESLVFRFTENDIKCQDRRLHCGTLAHLSRIMQIAVGTT